MSSGRHGAHGRRTDARSADRASAPPEPQRMSVWPVASHTRTPVGTGIIGHPPHRECAVGCRHRCRRRPHHTPIPQRDLDALRFRLRAGGVGGEAGGASASAAASSVGVSGAERAKVTGMKADVLCRSPPSQASRCQRNNRLGLIPCRRATAEMFTPGRSASATTACFSAALHRRRVSVITEYRPAKLSPDIVPDLSLVASTRVTGAISRAPHKAAPGVQVLHRCPATRAFLCARSQHHPS
jgi:hypothetical protein